MRIRTLCLRYMSTSDLHEITQQMHLDNNISSLNAVIKRAAKIWKQCGETGFALKKKKRKKSEGMGVFFKREAIQTNTLR